MMHGLESRHSIINLADHHLWLRPRRPLSVSNPAVQATPLVAQAFTLNGQRASLTDANGNATTYTWDEFDRLSTTSWPGGSYETLGYDAGGNVTTRGTRAGQPIAYAYDGLNRLVPTSGREPFGSTFPPPL